jgi:hypothetical protein
MKLAKQNILKLTEEAHKIAEETYRGLRANAASKSTLEQRQFLLTDIACHLIQDAMSDNIMNSQSLKNRLYAILIISDNFLPDKKLKEYADKIIS